ncbi:MAG: high-potential iron-sulfur protein [Bdellovibrionales bacterium]
MKSTRRDLLKKAALGGTALAAVNLTAACSKKETTSSDASAPAEKEATTATPYVETSNTTAQALGYTEDAASLEEGARPDKGATKGADQTCVNCQFYTADSSTDGVGGKCSLFPGKLVKGAGWCRSWSLKAQV